MEAVSQVVLRNAERLEPADPILLVNPSPDALYSHLSTDSRPVYISTQDHGDFRWLSAAGASVAFETVPRVKEETRTVIVVLPREKDRLRLLLHALASNWPNDARLWLVGGIRSGIKSSPRLLREFFGAVGKIDSARHCVLLEAREPQVGTPFRIENYERRWTEVIAGRELSLVSLPGVFAHGRLDAGTALLLDSLAKIRPRGRILDFACGCGVIGASILLAEPEAGVTLLDSSALAIEASRRTLSANGLQATLLASDGLREVSDKFDWIISNPPFHRGVANDFETAANFFSRSGTFLTEKGRILIVFNRHLPYSRWTKKHFAKVECLAKGNEFTVIQASKPK